jgi:hypothetical protein
MNRNWLTVFVVLTFCGFAQAESAIYSLDLTGGQEVPGPGDPDGMGSGILSLDDASGVISWDITYSGIAAPTAMHIHGPGGSAGSSAGVAIGLGVATTGGPDTLIGSLTHGELSEVSAILANPSDFYVNIHNADFGPGAIRGQLGTLVPEPSGFVASLLALGMSLGLIRRSQ